MLENLKRALPKFHKIILATATLVIITMFSTLSFYAYTVMVDKIFNFFLGILTVIVLTDSAYLILETCFDLNKNSK